MKLTKQEYKTLGKLQKEDCPKCGKKVMMNNQGLIWCSGVYCRFGFRELREYFWHNRKPNEKHKI